MSRNKAKILFVDDDPSLLRLLTIRLENEGFQVCAVSSGKEALSQLITFQPDVVITDLKMDEMDGMALVERLRQQHTSLPVIMMTAHGTIPDAVKATRLGVHGFVTKPVDKDELLRLLEEAIQISGGTAAANDADGWASEILTRSPKMKQLLDEAKLAARTDISVLIQGESGTGKELLAQALHSASPRRGKSFVAINCGAIPENLLESELFGHKKGAFTGAAQDHEGLFQAASGGTLFLDEIGDMPAHLQVKLLRALQEKKVRPVGGVADIPIDVRIISATHRDLAKSISDGQFREDLFYRLNVVCLQIPSLNERREDIPLLCNHFLQKISQQHQSEAKVFAPDAMELLVTASWPGNIRQLINVIEQTVVLSTSPVLPASSVQKAIQEKSGELMSFAEARSQFEREYLVQLLQITEGNVTQASKLAKRNRTEFYKLLSRHELDSADFKAPRRRAR